CWRRFTRWGGSRNRAWPGLSGAKAGIRTTARINASALRLRSIRATSGSQIAAQLRGGGCRRLLEVERRDKAAVLVHEINHGGVVHGVVAAVGGDLFGVHPISLQRSGDRGRVAGEAAQMRIEIRQIVLEHRRRVALRIDRDE